MKLNRRIGLIAIALGSLLLVACQPKILTPSELEAAKIARDAYVAYGGGDCVTVRALAAPERLEVWAFNEMRHSLLLLQGFCRELDGDIKGARDVYRQLVLEAPTSFAADDAAERTRVLKLSEEDPDYDRWTRNARARLDPSKPRRTPVDRVPVEFPPLAKASGVEGHSVVEFGITRRGETENPIIVESSPPFLFDGASLRAVRRWQYLREPTADSDDRQLIRILFKSGDTEDAPEENDSDLVDPG